MWLFLFYNKDFNENRAHVHVDKKDTQTLCKIWLEPTVEIAKQGDLTDAQAKERANWYLMGGGVSWDSCPEVIHVEQILGDYQKYGHEPSA